MTDPSTYMTAKVLLVNKAGDPVTRRKIANHTYLVRTEPQAVALRLHDTDVLTYRAGTDNAGTITFNSGGWITMTTMERINRFTPHDVQVITNRGTWEIRIGIGLATHTVQRFADGATIQSVGTSWMPNMDTFPTVDQWMAHDRHNTAMRHLIGRYTRALDATKLREAHDNQRTVLCPLCVIVRTDTLPKPKPTYADRFLVHTAGDAMEDVQHLVEHLHQGVYPYPLLWAACANAGQTMQGFTMRDTATTKRALTRYLGTRLYLGATAPLHGKRPIPSLTGASA